MTVKEFNGGADSDFLLLKGQSHSPALGRQPKLEPDLASKVVSSKASMTEGQAVKSEKNEKAQKYQTMKLQAGDVKAPRKNSKRDPSKIMKKCKSKSQRNREYRERQKIKKQIELQRPGNTDPLRSTSRKTSAYMREYRRKVKLKKQILQLNALLTKGHSNCSKEIVKTTIHPCKEEEDRKQSDVPNVSAVNYDEKNSIGIFEKSTQCVKEYKERKRLLQPHAPLGSDEEEKLRECGKRYRPGTKIRAKKTLAGTSDADIQVSLCKDDVNIAKYSNYYEHTYGHLNFFDNFKGNTFGHSCAVCDRLWWERDLKDTSQTHETILKTILPDYVVGASVKVCTTCKMALDRRKIPALSTYNGFSYPAIPSHLPSLDIISRRFISARLPFSQIRRLRHVHGRDKIFGQIINIPLSSDTMVDKLPRNMDNDHCFYVHLGRKSIHRSSYVRRLVSKENIEKWLTYLIQTPLYVHHNVTVNEEFFKDDQVAPDVNMDDISEHVSIQDCAAQQQTLLWNEDKFLRAASREKRNRVGILFDSYAEELSFPTIFCGQFRKYREEVNVTLVMQAISELRRTDRRGADPEHLLYVATKIMRQRIKDSITVALKRIGYNAAVPKEQLKSNIASYIDNFIESNLAFLHCVPNSTWYWAERERDLLAMVKQRGPPTAFMSLSANEVEWTDLLKLLYRLKHKGSEISDEWLSKMSRVQRADLVHEDAVTCAIYFNRLVDCLLHVLQYKNRSPFSKYRVVDYFKKIEFHDGGGTNARIFLWLDNAPKNLLNNGTDVIQMIDELISVSASEASGNIKLQTHEHSDACHKREGPRSEHISRCEAPFMPSRKTVTLLPMAKGEDDEFEQKLKEYRCYYKLIQTNLESIDYIDFDHFYAHNNIESDEHYYKILRAGIDRPKLFYKRTPSEKWHNPFNPFVFHHLQSTMDFQIIQDAHACAACIVGCVNKTDTGVGDFRQRLIEMFRENPDLELADMMQKAGVDIVHSGEMSPQEAAWYLLREPMAKSTIATAYIPTIQPTERQKIRKTMGELSATDGDSTDTWQENWFDKYEKRPVELEEVTLARFVSRYNRGGYGARKVPRVIRYRNYDVTVNSNDHKREMVLLHIPFRSEARDVLAENKFIQIYEENVELISERTKEFESNLDIEAIVETYRRSCRDIKNYDDNER